MSNTASQYIPEPVRFDNGEALRLAGISVRHEGMHEAEIAMQWPRFLARLDELGAPGTHVGARRFGLVTQRSQQPFVFDYLTAVEAARDVSIPEGFVAYHLAAGRRAVFVHDGHVSGLRALIDGIFRRWLPASGEVPSRHPDFCEVYGSDFDPVRLEGRIEVWLPLQSSTT